MAHIYRFYAEQHVPRPVDEVFAFFSQAENLERLTPKWAGLAIVTPPAVSMKQGSVIDYRIRMAGLPLRWQALIEEWQPPHYFVDRQLKGPFHSWRHRHGFEAKDDGTTITDEIHYSLPLGPLGTVAHHLAVKHQLKAMFAYRKRQLAQLFGEAGSSADRGSG